MIAVIQCAARKRADAGCLRREDGTRVIFIASPDTAPQIDGCAFARPDDETESGATWRDVLHEYNRNPADNPFGLLPAFELYANDAYRDLTKRLGVANTYILSAGWGLINAEFLTPCYDITFSAMADSWKRRRKGDTYRDFSMLPVDTAEPIVFFGGKDYLPLFCQLTDSVRSEKTVFYNSSSAPKIRGGYAVRFPTTTRTNWHYECVNAFLRGDLHMDRKSPQTPQAAR